jgi:alcohol dehydrogenase YqhD (iron-dependent ADH family)
MKRSCDTDFARPVFSIMNPELTYTIPMYHTLAGAFDAIAHAMERYFTNTRFVDVSDRLGESVMRSLMKYMRLVKNDPENYDIRAEIMWGCKVAQDGAFGVGREQCWESHILQRDIGSLVHDSSHGAGLAVIVPAWMRYVYKHDIARFAQWANRVMDVEIDPYDIESSALAGIDRLAAFIKRIGLPTTLREVGLKNEEDIFVMAEIGYPKGNEHLGGFTGMTKQDYINILKSAF